MNDLKDKLVEATENVLNAEAKIKKDVEENSSEAKDKMDAMNSKVKGKFNQFKGGIKEDLGKMTDNHKLQAEGIVDKAVGKAQEMHGELQEAIIDTKNKFRK